MTIAEQRFLESVPSRLMDIENELAELNNTLKRISEAMPHLCECVCNQNNIIMED